ncbi:MAG: FHA domain-containing serine/threonine-protein kinase [Chloroflexota bacterium]
MTELLGQTVGKYELLETIGSGGLATVYKARQADLDRWVAVKILHYKENQALARFAREAQSVARLRHRNIVIVYEYGEDGSWPYIAMEYIEGGTLEDKLKKGEPLDWIKVIDLIIPVAEALEYAHSQGLIHRDVKPSNILLPQDDWPLLADFGLVKVTDTNENLTGPGMSMGTPAYVAPEQARGLEVDHRSDIYSLGVLMFEMVTGRLPFDYHNPNKILLAHISEPVPFVRKLNPNCPAALEKVIMQTMQKQPDDRYDSMDELIKALKDVLSSSDQRPAFHKPVVPAPSEPMASQETVIKSPISSGKPREDTKATHPTSPVKSDSPSTASTSARILLVDKKASVPLPDKNSLIIGRTHQNSIADVDLGPYGAASSGVSRRHARFIREDNRWLIDDMGSLNGTFVNDVKVTPGQPVALNDGDFIRCSHLNFIFLISS